ncbi:DUF5017 domain-containing protein [Pedobacter sp. SD-b]|uniref:DUF5017 domain-containing protein n=1 Tax=Pedobacter segetis TaxID=2793069 RepID=A0ABS1BN19_9SPHI|nr:DUF5017 domain-containing protein [Pedobacter segetis]MBK0384162.1 DUF5017 domain-containing protein [Pedobacter segetis]
MKKLTIILLGFIAVITACNKKEVTQLSFDVSSDKTKIKVGDTLTYSFSGNANFVTYYSGEAGSNYANKERITADGTPTLEFTSYKQYGTQENTLNLLASTNFGGVYTDSAIRVATWTDITNSANLSTGTDNTPSGPIDLSAFKGDKPVFIAFKYNGTTGSTQRTWTIKNLSIDNYVTDGSKINIANIANAGWRSVKIAPSPKSWSISSTQLQFAGGTATTDSNVGWVITQPLFLNKVAPDIGLSLKSFSNSLESYQKVFTQAGVYKTTFVATNSTIYGSETVVKQIEITVE